MKYFADIQGYLRDSNKDILVIFGAGATGKDCRSFLWKSSLEIACFIDSNPELAFRQVDGSIAFSPDMLAQFPIERTFVFAAVENPLKYEKMAKTLDEIGFSANDYCHVNRRFFNKNRRFQENTQKTCDYISKYEFDKLPLFRQLEIELINRCNGKCGFCPVSAKVDPRPLLKMSDELFYSIVSQLRELKYTGRISLHSNSEPLLDERIIPFTSLIHKELPDAYFILLTNGTLLTLDKFKSLIECLDFLLINNYRNDYEFHAGVKEVYEYCLQHPDIAHKVRIHKRLDNEVLTTRGGNSPNAGACEVFGHVCAYPFSQMIIRPDGKLSLCCNDPLGQMTLGDLNKQTILEAWNGGEYKQIRERMQKGSEFIPLCYACDNSPVLLENPDPNNKIKNRGSLVRIGK